MWTYVWDTRSIPEETARFIGLLPGIDGPLADQSALRAYMHRLRQGRFWSLKFISSEQHQ